MPTSIVALLAACDAPCPLVTPEVVGGTQLQRRVVGAAVASFEAWVGPGRTCTREVRLVDGPLEGRALGRFLPDERVVELDRSHREPSLAATTIHELCHGLDIGAWISPADAARWVPLVRRGADAHPSHLPLEGFAQLCDLGPVTLAAFASCPDAAGVADPRAKARWMLDEVFVAATPTPWPVVDEGTWTLAEPAQALVVDEGADGRPRVVAVGWEIDGARRGWTVPLQLGSVLVPPPHSSDRVARGAARHEAFQPNTHRRQRAEMAVGQATVFEPSSRTAAGDRHWAAVVQTPEGAFHVPGVCGDDVVDEALVDVDGLPTLLPASGDVAVASTDEGTFVLTVEDDVLTWRQLADTRLGMAPRAGRSPTPP